MINFMMMTVPLVPIIEMLIPERSFIEPTVAPLNADYKEIFSMKVATIELSENMDISNSQYICSFNNQRYPQ